MLKTRSKKLRLTLETRLTTMDKDPFDDIDPNVPLYEVEIDEWREATEGILATTEMGPCVGVAIYDPINRIGYLGHFESPMITSSFVTDMLEAIPDEVNKNSLRVWVGGGAPFDRRLQVQQSVEDYSEGNQRAAAELLTQFGIREDQIETHWLSSGEGVIMLLDIDKGQVSFSVFDSTDEMGNPDLDFYDEES